MSEKTLFPYIDPPPPGFVGMGDGVRKDVKIPDQFSTLLREYKES